MVYDLSGGGVPKYFRVANELRRQIKDGVYQPGDQLPSESKLVDQFRYSQPTIRAGIGVLRAEGLVDVIHGKGVYVRKQPRLRRVSRKRYARARADKQLLTSSLRHEILFAGEVEAPADVASSLGVEPGTHVWVRRRLLHEDDGNPVELGASYLPLSTAQGELREAKVVSKALFLIVEDITGKRYTHAEDRLVARMPTAEETQALGIQPGLPVLHLQHTAYAEDETVLEVSESVWPADRAVVIDRYDIPTQPDERDASDI